MQLTQFAIDICEGMKFLEIKNVVHRDLAARNVLLDDELTAKISDFGLAKDANECQYAESALSKFPIKWTAPEALRYSVSILFISFKHLDSCIILKQFSILRWIIKNWEVKQRHSVQINKGLFLFFCFFN